MNDDEFDLSGGATGWCGLNLATNINLGENDVFRGGVVYGEGIQNYMNDASVDIGVRSNFRQSGMKESEQKINNYSRLLEAVNKILLNFYQQDDFRKLLNKLFKEILILINSRFGFVAEVLRDEQRTPYLNSNGLLEFYPMEISNTTIREKRLQDVLHISPQVNRFSGVINDIKHFQKDAVRTIKVVPMVPT